MAALAIMFLGMKPAMAASPVTGAIFTTISDGSEVNYNQYSDKNDVYLDGGPGVNAPVGAAGLPDGIYVFQVTDPSGKTLLSTDAAGCRQFTVSGGVIVDVNPAVAFGCAHLTATNVTTTPAGVTSITVQLMPFNDTPNNGGVYKVWATPLSSYLCSLTVVNCGFKAGSNVHGFVPSQSKTDNFKVKQVPVREIDTKFFDDATGADLDGRYITWTDTLGASNIKWAYTNVNIDVNHEAHIEAPENGTHYITITNQPGCTIDEIDANNTVYPGPATIPVSVTQNFKSGTIWIQVWCKVS